ncbi:hypothetical protein [Paraglaciecola sp. 25GB23A]|uniref:hypothetical protein n=1 Tax=Paraglaciecola sp. 25GB23A TaxID=3156068 RepID=UPI0032AF259F
MRDEIQNNFNRERKQALIKILTAILEVTKAELPRQNSSQLNLFDTDDHFYLAVYNAVWRIETDHHDAFYTMQYIDRFINRHDFFAEKILF